MNARTNLLALALLSLTLIGIGGIAFFLHTQNTAVTEARRNTDNVASMLGDQITRYLDHQRRVAHAISGSPLFSRALAPGTPDAINAVNALLDHSCRTLSAAVCYLMDSEGNTITSSNRDSPTSFVGNNYAFRPYFQKARGGTPAIYLALGVTSKKRGVYFSSPITTPEGTINGVLVIKAPVKDLEEQFADYPGTAALIDTRGVVFASNRKAWLYQSMRPLSEDQAAEISKSRQFGSQKPKWLGLREIPGGRATHPDGRTYLIAYSNLAQLADWQVVYLFDVAGISVFGSANPLNNTIMFGFGAIFLIAGFVVVFLYRTGSRDLRWRIEAEEALRNSSLQLRHQSTALLGLMRNSNAAGTDLDWALSKITKAASDTLNVGRCSIWIFDKNRIKINCISLYEENRQTHSDGLELEAKDYPNYFDALNEGQGIAADDAHTDPRTKEFSESYLSPLGITSMIDSPIWLKGKMVGVVCHEHVGQPREWSLEEQSFAGSIANMVASAIEASERRNLENQIRQSQKMEAVGQLAGGIAHEFNNLLQMIMGFNELSMEATPPSDNRHEFQQRIRNTVERGATLVKQLLGFSHKQMLQPTVLNVNDLISSLTSLLNATLGEQIELRLDLEPTLSYTLVDKGALEQIILNLCNNSRDAMKSGGSLTLETRNVTFGGDYLSDNPAAKQGGYVRIRVTDTGEGIAEDVREHIFEPFFTTKGPQEGSGLGLSMVYGLIEQHEGWIDVSSKEGMGTTFEIYLPEHSTAAVEEDEPKGAAAPLSKNRGTILVAEDEKGLQEITSAILEKEGYTVISAFDGEEAIRLLEARQAEIDLVLLDLIMPKLGGMEVYEHIRRQNLDVSVLFQTGYELKGMQAELLVRQGLTLLRKPYTPSELRTAVREHLQNSTEVSQ